MTEDPDGAHARIGARIDDTYSALSFSEGGTPDWARFSASYIDRALLALRLFPGDAALRVLDVEEYARAQMRDDLAQHGYTEVPGERSITVVGAVACVIQHFRMEFPDGTSAPAVDIFSLVQDDDWRIVSVVSDTA